MNQNSGKYQNIKKESNRQKGAQLHERHAIRRSVGWQPAVESVTRKSRMGSEMASDRVMERKKKKDGPASKGKEAKAPLCLLLETAKGAKLWFGGYRKVS